jgi:hypothetical protein
MYAPNGLLGAGPIDFYDATDTAAFPLGYTFRGFDPAFGYGEFMYCSFAPSTAVVPGTVVTWDNAFAAGAAASTANLGRPVGIARTNVPSVSNTTYGWVQIAGLAPATFSVAATVGAVYLGTAGNATPTAANGKQILNAYTIVAATGTVTKTCTTVNGSKDLLIPNRDGLFQGMAVSGTGIAGSSTIAKMGSAGRQNIVTLNNAMTANGGATITFTYTGFGLVQMQYPFSQGQVT